MYHLQASTFQMAVLLQFNEQTSLTVQQLGENTGKRHNKLLHPPPPSPKLRHVMLNFRYVLGIAQENLLQVLQILLKAKLLTCSDEESNLNGASVIELYLQYKK